MVDFFPPKAANPDLATILSLRVHEVFINRCSHELAPDLLCFIRALFSYQFGIEHQQRRHLSQCLSQSFSQSLADVHTGQILDVSFDYSRKGKPFVCYFARGQCANPSSSSRMGTTLDSFRYGLLQVPQNRQRVPRSSPIAHASTSMVLPHQIERLQLTERSKTGDHWASNTTLLPERPHDPLLDCR